MPRSPSSVLAEVQKLVRLAGHAESDENEARNAAARACRLLVEHEHAISIVLKEDDRAEQHAATLEPCCVEGPYNLRCRRHVFHGGKHASFHPESGRKLVWGDPRVPITTSPATSGGWQDGVGRVVGAAVGEALRKGIGRRR